MTETTATTDAPAETAPEAVDPNPELTAYKARVRELALALKVRFDWCEEETNEHLERLGLESLPERKTYEFNMPTTGVLRYRVTAYSEDEARETVLGIAANDVERLGRTSGYRSPSGHVVSVTADIDQLVLIATREF